MRSSSRDDYLKAILLICMENERASTGEIARRLGLAPASVSGMLRRLSNRKPILVRYEKSRGVSLTRAGRAMALGILRRHRLIETFLHRALAMPLDRVHEEAERLEHHISEELEDRIAAFLGDPETDPHGSPIPRKDGAVPALNGLSLTCFEVGRRCVVTRVSVADSGRMRYLDSMGLTPGAPLVIESAEPFHGPLNLRVGVSSSERRVALGRELAACVYVKPVES